MPAKPGGMNTSRAGRYQAVIIKLLTKGIANKKIWIYCIWSFNGEKDFPATRTRTKGGLYGYTGF